MTEPQLPIEYWDSGEVSRNKINNSWSKLLADVEAFRPSIWENWNWYIWETDTGIQAEWYKTEFRVNGWYIQYKTSDDNDWTNLIATSELKWDTWASIVSWEFSWNDLVFNKDDTTTVTIEDAKTTLKWEQWAPWEDWEDWASIVSWEFSWSDLVFNKDDGNTVVIEWAKNILTWPQWAPWQDWSDWDDWRWIESISHSKTWKDTTVTVEYDDWTEADEFVISDWVDGTDGTDGTDWRWIESITSSKSWKVTTVTIEYDDWTQADSFQISDWEDWQWAWDVLWPSSSTDWHVAWFDWTTGKLIKDLWALPSTASDVWALPDSTKYWASLVLSINSSTYVVTATLKDQDWNTLGTAQTIDLPLESVVVSGSYDSATKKVILTLQNWSTIEFSVADLVSWLQTEITSSNKLDADLVDDSTSTNKFVTSSDITKLWNLSGTNTWDETTASIKTKLGSASASADWYLTKEDFGTFNWKQSAFFTSWTTAPSNPNEWDQWYDTTNDVLKEYDWTNWNLVNTDHTYQASDFDISDLGDTNSKRNSWDAKQSAFYTKSNSAPSNPSEWDVWYDTTNDILKVYDGTNWKTIQELLVSWTNIKTINNNSILGSGDLTVSWLPSGWTNWQVLMMVNWVATWVNPADYWFIMLDSNSPITLKKVWAWTEAEYQALQSYDATTKYDTV